MCIQQSIALHVMMRSPISAQSECTCILNRSVGQLVNLSVLNVFPGSDEICFVSP